MVNLRWLCGFMFVILAISAASAGACFLLIQLAIKVFG